MTPIDKTSDTRPPTNLKLSEQLRVGLALTGELRLDRRAGIELIHMLETREEIEELTQRLRANIADLQTSRERQNKILDSTLMACLWLAGSIAAMAALLASPF